MHLKFYAISIKNCYVVSIQITIDRAMTWIASNPLIVSRICKLVYLYSRPLIPCDNLGTPKYIGIIHPKV